MDGVPIKYLTHFDSTSPGETRVPQGTTIQEFLDEQGVDFDSKVLIMVNLLPVGEAISTVQDKTEGAPCVPLNYVLQAGDRVSVTPRAIDSAWLPRLKDFERYLRSQGFSFVKQGKGDHEIWANQEGEKITVNPLSSNRHEVDKACLRALASYLQISYGELLQDIRDFRKK